MKHLSDRVILKTALLLALALLFLSGCSTANKGAQPVPSVSPAAPTTVQPAKEERPTPPPAEQTEIVPAEPPPAQPRPPAVTPKATPPSSALRVVQVVWSSVNLRAGPGLNHKVIGNAKKGSSLAIMEEKGEWLHVRLEDGKEVWVSRLATSIAPKPPANAAPRPPANAAPKPKPM
jgi:hypothetical protein